MSTLTEPAPTAPPQPEAVELTYREAVNAALEDAMAEDPSVVLMGEDVDADGGVTRELDVHGWPTALLIAPDGTEAWMNVLTSGEGLQDQQALDFYRDQAVRSEVYDAIQGVFADYDLLITPTLAGLPVENADDGNTVGPSEINGEAVDLAALRVEVAAQLARHVERPQAGLVVGQVKRLVLVVDPDVVRPGLRHLVLGDLHRVLEVGDVDDVDVPARGYGPVHVPVGREDLVSDKDVVLPAPRRVCVALRIVDA